MQTFSFLKHVPEIVYPESSARVKFGRGYQFASRPRGPDQINYVLHFTAMFFWESAPGVFDTSINPTINMAKLIEFYEEHRLYEPFIYPLAGFGDKTVRFDEPLKFKMKENGRGQTDPFQIKLILQP